MEWECKIIFFSSVDSLRDKIIKVTEETLFCFNPKEQNLDVLKTGPGLQLFLQMLENKKTLYQTKEYKILEK